MQAAEYATSVCPSHSRDWYPIQNVKFAELIVRECIEQVITGPNGLDLYAVEAALRLKKHFGVE